jgi:diaminopimelate decarboxylase
MTKSAPQHSAMSQFSIRNNNLVVAGIELPQLVERVGQTPFYAYDRQLITQRMANLRQAMPDELKIHYAMKANPMPAVVQHMASISDGLDIASTGEMKVALDTIMPVENISIAGPGKKTGELRQFVAAGITVNVESGNELETLALQSEQLGITANVAIRINPAFELKTSGMKMGGGPKPFGIDEEQVPNALKRIRELDLNFKGFHIYSGSQNLQAASIIEAQAKSIALAIQLANNSCSTIEKLNIGGGYGIPYFPGESSLDILAVGEALEQGISNAKAEMPAVEVIIELGRYLVGEAGIYVCLVIDKKVSRGQTFLVCDGGLHHHLAASGNFGQVIRKNYPVVIGNKMNSKKKETINIVGPLCTPLDILANKIELPEAGIGDLVVIYQSGAYGITASPAAFLSQPNANEILI